MAGGGSEGKRSTAEGDALQLVLDKLPDARRSGQGWTARCPAHDDRHESLSVGAGDERAVLLTCFVGCAPDAVVRVMGLDPREILGARRNGTATSTRSGQTHPIARRGLTGITVTDLARDKGLPEHELRDVWGLRDAIGRRVVLIPYRDVDGTELFTRERSALSGNRGSKQPAGVKLAPYGLDRLADWKASDTPLLVEGESDVWAAWHHGYAALGLPGASSAGCLQAEHVEGVARIYVHQEPDRGGPTFVAGVRQRLAALGWTGELLAFGLIVDA